MPTIHSTDTMNELLDRLDKLQPGTQGLWGKMNIAQMLAHCCNALEQQLGDKDIKSNFISRIIGPLVRNKVVSEQPFKQSLPTAPEFVVSDTREFNKEKAKLEMLIKRVCQSTPDIFKNRRHGFFGKMTPVQWDSLVYKHLDHHFRQFGV